MTTTSKPAETAGATKFNSAADLAAAYPAFANELRALGAKDAEKKGADAERARILGIEAHALPGHGELVASLKADPSITADQAAGKILEAERKARGSKLAEIRGVEDVAGKVPAAPAAGNPASRPAAKSPADWAAEYEASTQLQSEFSDKETYVAFKKAEANGQAKFLRKVG